MLKDANSAMRFFFWLLSYRIGLSQLDYLAIIYRGKKIRGKNVKCSKKWKYTSIVYIVHSMYTVQCTSPKSSNFLICITKLSI